MSEVLDDREEIVAEKDNSRWFIDFEWYQQNNRSFWTSAKHCLCPKCRTQPKSGKTEMPVAKLLATIADCCSQEPEFITRRLPILESIFRLLLANGNQPLDLEGLGEQLRERLEGDTYRTSPEILSRLLSHDQHYGLRQISEHETSSP